MKRINEVSIFVMVALLMLIGFTNCSDDEEETTGVLKGIVADDENNPLADVRIILYDANTNSPDGDTYFTGEDGSYSYTLDEGAYYLRLSKQGFEDIPVTGSVPITSTVIAGQELIANYTMKESAVVEGGFITGKVEAEGSVLSGVLVMAIGNGQSYSSITGSDGLYAIYNVPAGAYKLKGYQSGYNSNEVSVTVAKQAESVDVNITMTNDANGSIAGTVTFLATENGIVDVSLVHPESNETVPGLSTMTDDVGGYALSNIPNGTYIARASFKNDGYVVDPDWLIKNGEPVITIPATITDLNFSVTGAVSLKSPNDSESTIPVEISDTIPTFEWNPYSSTSDYVIEVSDVYGNVIWGGFEGSGASMIKKVSVSKDQLSAVFNFDGSATADLVKGETYRWRIYASKDDTKEPTGWKLISMSEDQQGLFVIVEAEE